MSVIGLPVIRYALRAGLSEVVKSGELVKCRPGNVAPPAIYYCGRLFVLAAPATSEDTAAVYDEISVVAVTDA